MPTSNALIALISAVIEAVFAAKQGPDFAPRLSLPVALLVFIPANFFVLACYNFFIYPNFFSPLRHIPGPKGNLPLLGLAGTLFEKPPGHSHFKWMQTIKNDGFIRFQGLWNTDLLLVTSPAALAEMLVTKTYQFQKPENARAQLRAVLGDGLVVVEGDEHRFQRKRLMPTFGFRHIKDLYPVMWSKAQTLCARMNADMQDDSITIDLSDWASKATLDAIGVAALGRDFNSVYNDDDELAYLYRLITTPTTAGQIWFACGMLFGPNVVRALPLPINRELNRICLRLRAICRQLVTDKREAIAKRGDDHHDILSVLIKSNDFNDVELVDQMLTFLGAGSDTTSLTFTWTCYLLAKYPQVQQKLREELLSVQDQLAKTNGTSPDDAASLAATLESLPYLNGIFHETLRLYPTVPFTGRVATQPNTTLLGRPIPQGTEFFIPIVGLNRMPEFWGDDAEEFKPERWIDTTVDPVTGATTRKTNNHGGAANNYSFMTFLAGPRSCIGQNFARAELRCLLAAWVSTFEMVDANDGPVIAVGGVTQKPLGGMKLKLTPVKSDVLV